MFRKSMDQAEAGDNIGVLLRGTQRTDSRKRSSLAKPGTIHPHTKFKAQSIRSNKRRRVDVIHHSSMDIDHNSISEQQTLQVLLIYMLEQKWLCQVITSDMTIELITPIAIENGLRFAIREGGL